MSEMKKEKEKGAYKYKVPLDLMDFSIIIMAMIISLSYFNISQNNPEYLIKDYHSNFYGEPTKDFNPLNNLSRNSQYPNDYYIKTTNPFLYHFIINKYKYFCGGIIYILLSKIPLIKKIIKNGKRNDN